MSCQPRADGRLFEIFDGCVNDDIVREVYELLKDRYNFTWYLSELSVGEASEQEIFDPHNLHFWNHTFDIENVPTPCDCTIKRLYDAMCEEFHKRTGKKVTSCARAYANGQHTGMNGLVHYDGRTDVTLLYYPMMEWHPNWHGETLFYNESFESKEKSAAGATDSPCASVLPRKNRFIAFDAKIFHVGMAPAPLYKGLRVSIAFKVYVE